MLKIVIRIRSYESWDRGEDNNTKILREAPFKFISPPFGHCKDGLAFGALI